MAKEPLIDRDACIGCGLCADNVPNVFRMTADGKAECHDPKGAPEEEIEKNAIDVCPAACIRWKE